MDRNYLRAVFRIRLHIDDIATLYKIKEFLGVGYVTIHGSNCLYTIGDLYSLKTVLLPLLDEYNLLTSKWLDYLDFKSVVNYLYTTGSSRLSADKLAWASAIINGMNSGRTVINSSLMPTITINPFWLLGFIEAEGTFGLKTLSPYFQLAQHSRNLILLEAIALYLKSLVKGFTFSVNTSSPVIGMTLNKRTSVSVLSIRNIDALYDYLMFFLLDMPFQTRKGEEFYYWCLVLHMHKLGYFYLSEGRSLTANIANYINKGRYSNNPDKSIAPSIETINNVLSLTLPVTITPEMLHVDLAQKFARAISTRNIWVYDNGVLVNDKPFTTFASANASYWTLSY